MASSCPAIVSKLFQYAACFYKTSEQVRWLVEIELWTESFSVTMSTVYIKSLALGYCCFFVQEGYWFTSMMRR